MNRAFKKYRIDLMLDGLPQVAVIQERSRKFALLAAHLLFPQCKIIKVTKQDEINEDMFYVPEDINDNNDF